MKYIQESNRKGDRFDKQGKLVISIYQSLVSDLNQYSEHFDIRLMESMICGQDTEIYLEGLNSVDADMCSSILRDEYTEYRNEFSDMHIYFKLPMVDEEGHIDEDLKGSTLKIVEYRIKLLNKLKEFIESLSSKGYDIGKLVEDENTIQFKYHISTYLNKSNNLFKKINGQ